MEGEQSRGERGANSFIIVAVVIGNLDQSLGAHETYKAVPAGLDEIDYTCLLYTSDAADE